MPSDVPAGDGAPGARGRPPPPAASGSGTAVANPLQRTPPVDHRDRTPVSSGECAGRLARVWCASRVCLSRLLPTMTGANRQVRPAQASDGPHRGHRPPLVPLTHRPCRVWRGSHGSAMFLRGDVGIWIGYAQAATMDVAEPRSLRACPDGARGTRKRPVGRASSARDDQTRDGNLRLSVHGHRPPVCPPSPGEPAPATRVVSAAPRPSPDRPADGRHRPRPPTPLRGTPLAGS